MKLAYAGAALMLAVTVYAGTFSFEPELDQTMTGSISTDTSFSRNVSENFVLQVNGLDSGCTLRAGESDGHEKQLSLSPVCSVRVPALSGAMYWLDRQDGTVAFARMDGSVVAEFSVSDGAVLESYAPQQPIMTLLAN